MKTVLKYPGAKNRIAKWICQYIPPHSVYLEPFAGSLAVLFNKPRSHIETVNDLDGEIVNFFRVLREYPEELKRKIKWTPFAREEYIAAFEPTDDCIEKARRYCVRCWQGFSNSQLYNNGFKTGQQTNSPNPAMAWSLLPDTLMLAANRLKGVQIENLPAMELICRYDTDDVFIYLDPPYLPELRKSYLYKHEMNREEHKELLNTIVQHPGKIMISGYDNDLYNEYLTGWQKVCKSTVAESGKKRQEVLWMNYNRHQQLSLLDYI